jgi:hypothetical protein
LVEVGHRRSHNMRALLQIFHKETLLKELDLIDLDDCHKIIGLLNYGGLVKNGVKYLAEEYFVTGFEENVRAAVRLNVSTEAEIEQKRANSLAALDPSFVSKLAPIFQRRGGNGESVN